MVFIIQQQKERTGGEVGIKKESLHSQILLDQATVYYLLLINASCFDINRLLCEKHSLEDTVKDLSDSFHQRAHNLGTKTKHFKGSN